MYKCESVATSLLEIGCSIQDAIKNEETLKYYLQVHQDWKGRSTLEIIAQNRFYDYLKHPIVASMVSKLWYGNDESGGIWDFSTIRSIFSSNIKSEKYDDLLNMLDNEKTNNVYTFQFKQYINNCSQRNIINAMAQVFTALIYEAIVFFYVDQSSLGEIPDQIPLFYYFHFAADILVFTMNLNFIFFVLYLVKTGRKVEFNVSMFIEILLFAACLLDKIEFSTILSPLESYMQGLLSNTTYYENNELNSQYMLNSTTTSNDIFNFTLPGTNESNTFDVVTEYIRTPFSKLIKTIIFSIIILCVWFKVILVMITTRTFGPFLRIVYLLLSIMLNFGIIYFCFNIVWAQAMTLIFSNDNEDYIYFFNSFVSLFNATFGQYTLLNFRTSPMLGYIFTVIYVIMSNVMLLSLFVAIVSNQYQTHKSAADSENRVILVITHESIKWDDRYGLLILLPHPLNILSFFMVIILLMVPESKAEKVNIIMSKIAFILICFVNFFYLLIMSFVLYPIALLKSYIHTFKDSLTNFDCVVFFRGVLAFFTRPFVLLYYIARDCVYFWQISYKENEEIVNKDEERKKIVFDKHIVLKIRKVLLKQSLQKKRKKIHMNKLLKELKIIEDIEPANDLDVSFSSVKEQTSTNATVENVSQSSKDNIFPKDEMSSSNNLNNNSNSIDELNNSNTKDDSFELFKDASETLTEEERKSIFDICNKFTDKEHFINISRTLTLLENRLWLSNNYTKYLEQLNMKVLLSGVLDYHYKSQINQTNYIFEYKKIGHVINKINLKLKLLMNFIPPSCEENIINEFEGLNYVYKEKKTYLYLKNINEVEDLSDHGEDIEVTDLIKKPVQDKLTYFDVGSNNRKDIDKFVKILKSDKKM